MRQNIVVQYTLITFLIIFFSAVSLSLFLTREMETHLIRSHVSIYPSIIHAIVKDHPEFIAFLSAPAGSDLPPGASEFLDDLLSFEMIFRVKVWGSDATVLWSDQSALMGQNFPDNQEFLEALTGRVSWDWTDPAKNEHRYEKDAGPILEIYTPIRDGHQIVGVLEIYESDRALAKSISRNTRFIWSTIGAASLLLYLLLFLIYYRAHQRQRTVNEHLVQTQNATIYALASMAEIHDIETGYHLERTARYVQLLAVEMRKEPRYTHYLTKSYIEDLVRSTPLHDIGKVGIPDAVLHKPGKLTDEEFGIVKEHPGYGVSILRRAEARLGFQSFLKIAIQITGSHHERWDGTGYPHGLREDGIPLSARLMALADVYDALRSRRYYKEAFPHTRCVAIISAEAGKQFDPAVVQAFLRCADQFQSISEELSDEPGVHPETRGSQQKISAPRSAAL